LIINWMGPVNWYLGCHYEWDNQPDKPLSISITQTAHIEALLDSIEWQLVTPSYPLIDLS
jgi:hypothetical protein